MRRAAFALTMLLWLAAPAAAQDDGFAAFWKEFSAAAGKKDKAKIGELTKYPFYYDGKNLGPQQFDVVWKNIFDAKSLACLAKGKPKRAYQFANYEVFCKDVIYGFERTPQGWRFLTSHPND